MENNSSQNNNEIPLLTFNSLYNILREEKRQKSLQKLNEMFYEALKKYFEDKKKEIIKFKESQEQEKLRKEKNILKNSEKIAKELLNIRCVKISNIAVKNEIFSEDILSNENVLEFEKQYYDNTLKATSKIKKEVGLK